MKEIHYHVVEPPQTQDEIQEAFSRVGRDDALARSLRWILQQRLANAVIASTEAKLTDREAGIAAGRIEEIMDLQAQISELIEQSVSLRSRGSLPKSPR
jgi:hypothetical protein